MDTFRILVIDDNYEIHHDFKKILSPIREDDDLKTMHSRLFGPEDTKKKLLPFFKIDSAYQGIDGLNLVQKALANGEPYALAFVDVLMPPGWDGIETVQKIWQVNPEIQIVIVTAYSDYSWDDIANRLGTNDNWVILKKPFDNIEITQLACCLTQKWYLEQQVGHQFDKLHQQIAKNSKEIDNINF